MLIDLKFIKYIIFDEKSQFCIIDLKIVEFVCDSQNRVFKNAKIIKIVE